MAGLSDGVGFTAHQIRNAEFALRPYEIRRLLGGATSLRDRLIVEILAVTGIRRAEIRLLHTEDLDLRRKRLLINHGKGRKKRIVFVPTATVARLQRYVRWEGFLFRGRHGGPMSLRNINYVVGKVAGRAGVRTPNPRYRHVGPHLLRHSLARNWKRAGGSLESLQKLLGHASLKTTLDVYGTEDQIDTERNYRALVASLVAR